MELFEPRTPIHVLLTGATGSVGCEVAGWLRTHAPHVRLSALVRASSERELRIRWKAVLRAAGRERTGERSARARWTPLRGDVTQPQLGLKRAELAPLLREVTHIVHAAADIRFLAPLEESRLVNTLGTRNVLELAARCTRLESLAHVSTIFVAGRRTGRILEHELEHHAGFVSPYEQSKYEAELLARECMDRIPIAVYRLALLPGRRADGHVHQFGAFHRLLYYYERGLLETLPGAAGNRIDLAPTDWATEILLQLYLRHFEARRTYQVCSGESAVRLGDFVALTTRHIAEQRRSRGALAPLRIVTPAAYEEFLQRAARSAAPGVEKLIGVVRTTTPHAVLSKVFDRRAVQACLGTGARAPAFEEYFPRIVRYCIEQNWGKDEDLNAASGSRAAPAARRPAGCRSDPARPRAPAATARSLSGRTGA
jgi:long-chain acyl-CoA synthetase